METVNTIFREVLDHRQFGAPLRQNAVPHCHVRARSSYLKSRNGSTGFSFLLLHAKFREGTTQHNIQSSHILINDRRKETIYKFIYPRIVCIRMVEEKHRTCTTFFNCIHKKTISTRTPYNIKNMREKREREQNPHVNYLVPNSYIRS